MRRIPLLLALLALPLLLAAPPHLAAQAAEWRPPTTEMPMMPRVDEIQNNWIAANARWFRGVEAATGVPMARLRGDGERRRGSDFLQIARFGNGHLPVIVWSDRNGDGRADLIEIYRSSSVIFQLIDAGYSGRANVLRVYDGAGSLLREERL
ncbi:hypothetical protein BH23GEM6_BH23GEM6_08050 [soil metagenome]